MRWLLAFLALIVLSIPFAQRGTEHAIAQGQVFCQTRPIGTSDNSCASTAFVQAAVGGGGAVTIVNGTSPSSGFTDNYILTSIGNVIHQVIASITINGVTCALGGSCTVPTAGIANVSGSAQTTTGTISASSPNLTLAAAKDFVNGEGVRCNHCGAGFTLNQATGLSVTPHGSTGSTTWQYKVASIDAAGGVGAATTLAQTTTGNATLSASNFNLISWTAATGTAPIGYAVYKNISGTFTLIGISSAADLAFADYGYTAWPYADWLPSTAPASALADALVSTIVSGGGTISITLADNAITACGGGSNCGIYHDDTAAIQTYLNTGATTRLGDGDFYISSALAMADYQLLTGNYTGTNIISAFAGQTVIQVDAVDQVSNVSFELLPLSKGIYGNGAVIIKIDNIYCQGSSVGTTANSDCIDAFGGYQYSIRDVYSDYWPATIGFGSGGMPPTVLVDYNPATNNTSIFMSNMTVSNDGNQVMSIASGVEIQGIKFDNCYNCSLSHSYLNGQNPTPTKAYGGIGVGFYGAGQALYITDTQLLNFQENIRMDSDTSGSPLNLNVVDAHFDFCQNYCILGQAGQQINISGSTFVGEGNSPWLFANNAGIHTAAGFTAGPNLIYGNGFNNFSGSGAAAISFSGTMTNTMEYGNGFVSNTTNVSGGGSDASSVIGVDCPSGISATTGSSLNGVLRHC